MKKKIILIKYLIIILLYFFAIEILSRIFIWGVTTDLKAFSFGFNKNIQINIFWLKELDIAIEDQGLTKLAIKRNLLNKKNNNKKDIVIWTFGGSTTIGKSCGSESSSWPTELEKIDQRIKINNLAYFAADSDKSLYLLKKQFVKNKPPDVVVWANKFNEIGVIYQGLRGNRDKLKHIFSSPNKKKLSFFLLKLDKTFKSNFVSYKLLDHIVLRISRKLLRSINPQLKHIPGALSSKITNDDFKYASLNYKINTQEAIEFTKKNKVDEFFILSLPSRSDYTKIMKNKFYAHYNKRIDELIKEYNIKLIDLSTLNNFKKKEQSYFCDTMHKTLEGNILTAKIIHEYLKNNSSFFK
jgi:hypothetical protein